MPAVASPSSPTPAPITLPPIDTTFSPSLRVPVAGLTPNQAAGQSYIEATIALVWPFSNSTDTFALLLVDYTSRGQVKVIFRNGAARQVANTKVGIGDKINLALLGCQWKEIVETISTPGKRLEWDLQYDSRVVLKVHPHSQDTIVIDYTAPASEHAFQSAHSKSQPPLNGFVQRTPTTIPLPYLTPSKSTRTSFSGTFFDTSIASLADDDGYVVGRGRKRTKFARHSGAWNLVDDEEESAPESIARQITEEQEVTSESNGAPKEVVELSTPKQQPIEVERTNEPDSSLLTTTEGDDSSSQGETQTALETPPAQVSSDAQYESTGEQSGIGVGPELDQTSPALSTTDPDKDALQSGTTFMGPPATPFKQLHLPQFAEVEISDPSEGDGDRAPTPRILPLASPGLPLVSPLVQRSGVEVGYFPAHQNISSQLDATAEKDPDEVEAESHLDGSEGGSTTSDDSIVIVEERVSESWQSVEREQDNLVLAEFPADSFNGISQVSSTQDISPTETSLLPDQWLSTLEASIAHELSNNAQSPIDVELDQPFSTNEVHFDPQNKLPPESTLNRYASDIAVAETEDLYGAPGDEVAQPSWTEDQTQEVEHDKALQSENNAAEVSAPSHLTNLLPTDHVEHFLYPHPVAEGLRQNVADLASEALALESKDQDTRGESFHTLDGNIDVGDNFDAGHVRMGLHAEAVVASQLNVSGIVEPDQGTAKLVESAELPADARISTSPDAGDVSLVPAEIAQQSALSPVQPSEEQFQAGDDNTQLPTPDQTQHETFPPEHELENEPEQSQDQLALPSPRPTQDTHTAVDFGSEQDKEFLPTSSPEIPHHAIQREDKQASGLRSSQRLSSRKPAMLKNISSPYLTPRRSARFSTSPSREENIPLSSPYNNKFPSSPYQNEQYQEKATGDNNHSIESPRHPPGESLVPRTHGLLTPLGYYPRLSSLHEHFGQLLDIIAICSASSSKAEKAKAGPRDYHTSLYLVDPSCQTDQIPNVLAQVFRPLKKALPVTKAGDIVILHNFKVHTVKKRFALLSSDTSSWSVLSFTANLNEFEVVTSGPPLERGSVEAEYASSLWRWWDDRQETDPADVVEDVTYDDRSARASSDGPATRTRLRVKSSPVQATKAFPKNAKEGTALEDGTEMRGDQAPSIEENDGGAETGQLRGSTISPSQPRKPLPGVRRRRANKTDNMANEGDKEQVFEDSDLENPPSPVADRNSVRRESTISTAPSNVTQNQGREFTPRRSARIGRSPSVVHELRDGTKYVDDPPAEGDESLIHELRDGVTYIDE